MHNNLVKVNIELLTMHDHFRLESWLRIPRENLVNERINGFRRMECLTAIVDEFYPGLFCSYDCI